MAFSFPTIQEFLERVLIDHTCSLNHIKQVNERFYYLLLLQMNIIAPLFM